MKKGLEHNFSSSIICQSQIYESENNIAVFLQGREDA